MIMSSNIPNLPFIETGPCLVGTGEETARQLLKKVLCIFSTSWFCVSTQEVHQAVKSNLNEDKQQNKPPRKKKGGEWSPWKGC